MSATNLPWTRNKYGEVLGANGRTVELNGFASVVSPGVRQDEAKANAVAVILAVNSHDELIAALRECRAALTAETIGTVNMDDPDWYEAVAKAVAKADAALSRIPDIQIKGAA